MHTKIAAISVAFTFWLVAGHLALAAGLEVRGQPALTLTLSRPTFGRCPESGPAHIAVRQSRLEERLFADAADGKLDEFSPLGAALIAGGVEDTESLHRYQQKAAAIAERLRRSGVLDGKPAQRAETIFDFMHREILRGGYDLAYTDLRRLLDEGRFNCISATVLFNYLAGEMGLECRILETPSHAMSRVVLPDGLLEIETTCPQWFHLQRDPKPQPSGDAKLIGAADLADRSKAREVSVIQMAAMIYYNRGVALLAEKRFAEAAAANAKALRLDPQNAVARGNLLATINNWSIELGNAAQFAEAVELLRQGLQVDPKFEPFAQNYVHFHRQWADHLCRAGRFAEAVDTLSRAAAELPDRGYLRRAQDEVRQQWLEAAACPQAGPIVQMPCGAPAKPLD